MTNSKKKGLGRSLSDLGLGELLSSMKHPSGKSGGAEGAHEKKGAESVSEVSATTPLLNVAVELLCPNKYQPRQEIETANLSELVESIKQQGIIQPIAVRILADKNKKSGSSDQRQKYEIIAGERRWRAAQLAALKEVPVIVHNLTDEQTAVVALIENLQREDLTAIDTAQGLQRLVDIFGMSHEEAAKAVGKSRASVTNLLRLLQLPEEIKKMLQAQKLDMGHARALLALPSKSEQMQIANMIVAKCLSVRAAEDAVRHMQENKSQGKSGASSVKGKRDPDVARLEMNLQEALGAKVEIKHTMAGKGKMLIHYQDLDELDGILKKLQ